MKFDYTMAIAFIIGFHLVCLISGSYNILISAFGVFFAITWGFVSPLIFKSLNHTPSPTEDESDQGKGGVS